MYAPNIGPHPPGEAVFRIAAVRGGPGGVAVLVLAAVPDLVIDVRRVAGVAAIVAWIDADDPAG
jgi:hypothetical protein